MPDERNDIRELGPESGEARKQGGNPLGFALEFSEGAAQVTLAERTFTGGLKIERLALEIPDVRFPFDVSGGAEQFRHHRCRLKSLAVSISQSDLGSILIGALDPARFGLEDIRLIVEGGLGWLGGVLRTGSSSAPFTARFMADPGPDLSVRLALFDLRIFGWLPLPAVALVSQLERALRGVGAGIQDATFLVFHPVRDLVRWLLPVHGWKIPDREGVRIERIEFQDGQMRLTVGRPERGLPPKSDRPGTEPAPERQREFASFLAQSEAYREAELALRGGKLDEARVLYLGHGEVEPSQSLPARRLLEIAVCRPERFDELDDLVHDMLAQRPGFLPAMLAKAAREEKAGDSAAGRTYQEIAECCAETDEREDAIVAHLKASALLRAQDLAAAIGNLERVLSLNPDHRPAMRILTELYLEGKQWYRAVRMNLRLAHLAKDPEDLAGCHLRIGAIYLERFDDLERSRKHLETALLHHPENPEALGLLATVQQRRGQPARAAALLTKLVDAAEQKKNVPQLTDWRLLLARLWEEDLDDPAVALLHYERILVGAPDHLHSLFKVGAIAASLGQWEKAVQALSRLLDLHAAGRPSPEEIVKSASFILGKGYLKLPGGGREAREFLGRVVALDPKDLAAWTELELLDRAEKNWVDLMSVLEHKAALLTDRQQVQATILEAARLADRNLGDGQKAERFYRRALELEPGSGEAIGAVATILREEKRWRELADLLVAAATAGTDPKVASVQWTEVGKLRLERFDDPVGAMEALRLAVRLDPGNRRVVERLLDAFREQNRLEELVELIGDLEESVWEVPEKVNLWLERAQIQQEKLGRTEDAIASYQRCLDWDPQLLQAQRALADLFFASRKWAEARQATLQVLELAGEGGLSGPGRTELHRRLAAIELALGNRTEAIEQYRQVLTRFDQDDEAADRLAQLLREENRWEELAAFYARRAEGADGERSAALHTAAAAIWWEKLQQLEPAAAQYLLAVEAAPESDAAPARLGALQRVYATLGRWREVAEVLRRRIGMAPAAEVPPMYMALGAILGSRLDDPTGAQQCWETALAADPAYRPALLMLARRAYEQQRYEEALSLGKRALASGQPGVLLPMERRASVALDAGRAAWHLEKLEDATSMYQEYMEAFAPRRYAGVDSEALERLELLLREQRRFSDLALLYRRWLGTGLTPERQGGLQRSLSLLLFEHLDQPDEAVQVLHEHVGQAPEDQPAVRDLLRMLRESGRWEQLVVVLEEQADRAPSEKERIARLEELAEIYQLRLDHPEKAIAHLKQLLEMGHQAAQERLLAIYRQEGMHRELAELLRVRAEASSDPAEAARLFEELGQVAQSYLGDREMALPALRQAYALDPSPETRQALLQLLREAGDPAQLEEFLFGNAAEEEEPGERRALLLEHSELCLTKLDRRAEGLASLRAALEIEADEGLVRRAQTLYEEDDAAGGVADMQELLVDLAKDDATAARRLHRLGQLFRDRLDSPERAVAAFRRASELDPSWPEPLKDSAAILSSLEDWEELVPVWQRLADQTPAGAERTSLLRSLAHLVMGKQGDWDRGTELLRRAAEEATDPAPVWRELAEVLETRGQYSAAADALERVSTGKEIPAALLRRVAELGQRAGEEDRAIAALDQLLRQEPADEASAKTLQELLRRQNRHQDLARLLTDLAERQQGSPAAEAWLTAAQGWQEAGEDAQAEAALRRALAVVPGHEAASLEMLERLVTRRAWSELLDLLTNLPDELLLKEAPSMAAAAMWEEIAAKPESKVQELQACRVLLRAQPQHLQALQRYARLVEDGGDSNEAEAILRRLDALRERLDDGRRYELDLRLASIEFSRGRVEEAERRLKRCIAQRPDDPGPVAFLHKLYSGGQRFADRVALLLGEAERAPGAAERFGKLRGAAQLLELELGDPRGAAALMERVVAQEPDRLEAWRKLSELWRLLEEPEKQRQALRRLAQLSSGEERLQALRRSARLSGENLADTQGARQDWEEVLNLAPGDEEALDRLLEDDRKEGRFEGLARHLQQRLEKGVEPAQATPMLRELAGVLTDRLGQSEEAVGVWRRLRVIEPADQGALDGLRRLLSKTGHWQELGEVLPQQIEKAGSEKERVQLLQELAGLRMEHLQDAGGAVEALRQAVALSPEDEEPLLRLRALAAAVGNERLLADTLASLAQRERSADRERRLRQAVGLLCWKLRDDEGARQAFSRVLELNGDDAVARRFLAEVLLTKDPPAAATHLRWLLDHPRLLAPVLQQKIQRQLVEALAQGEPEERIPALERLLETVPQDRGAWQQLVDLYRQTGNRRALSRALLCLAALEDGERAVALWIERGDLLAREGNFREAADALAKALHLPGEHRYEVALQLAKLQLEELGDAGGALQPLEMALQVRPDEVAVLRKLAGAYTSLGRLEKATEAISRLLLSATGLERTQLALQLADLQIRMGLEAEAAKTLDQAIEGDPSSRQAFEMLEQILKKGEKAALAAFYLKWARSPAAGPRRASLFVDAGRFLERTGDAAGAIEALRESLQVDPTNPEAYELLAPLLGRKQDWEDLLQVLYRRRELAGDAERRLAIAFEMGEVCREHVRDLARAAVHFEFCLQLDPVHAGALEELADIRYSQQAWKEATALYQRLGDCGLAAKRFVVAFRKGEMAEAAGDGPGAVLHYRKSLELNPTFIPSRQNMVRVLGKIGDWDGVVVELEGLLQVLPAEGFEAMALDIWRQLGAAHRRLLRFEEAARCFHEVVQRDPQDVGAVRVLRDFYTNRLRWEEAAVWTRREIELEPPQGPDSAARWVMLGDLYSLRLSDLGRAEEAYRAAMELAPGDVELKWKLWKLLRSRGAYDELEVLGANLLEFPMEPGQEAEVRRVLGRARLLIADDRAGALVHLDRALELGGADLELVEEVSELAKGEKRWARFASLAGQALELRLGRGLPAEEAVKKYLELAQVYRQQLGELNRATACVRRALELKPRDPALMRHLGALYASDWETCREAIDMFRELTGMDPTDAALYRILARLEAARGDQERSAWYYAGLRFLAPVDPEARKFLAHVGPATGPQRPLNRGEWDEVMLHPSADCLLQRILAAVAPYLEQLFPASLDRFGVQGDDLVDRHNYPAVAAAMENARVLVSGRPLSVFVVAGSGWTAHLESGGTPAIVLPRVVVERSTPAELQFFMAREVVTVAMGCVLAMKFSLGDLQQLLALLCKLARPESDPPHHLPATSAQYIEAIQQVTPPDVLEMVTPLIRRYAMEPRAHDVDHWLQGVRRTAERVGLLACGDLNAALSVMTRTSEAAGGRELAFVPDRASLLQRDEAMMALFRFAFSEPFLKARLALGVSLGGKGGGKTTRSARG